MSENLIYECVNCGTQASKKQWERGQPYLEEWEREARELYRMAAPPSRFKCPHCGYRVAKKVRAPIVKRVKAR